MFTLKSEKIENFEAQQKLWYSYKKSVCPKEYWAISHAKVTIKE